MLLDFFPAGLEVPSHLPLEEILQGYEPELRPPPCAETHGFLGHMTQLVAEPTVAATLSRSSGDIESLSRILGHASSTTTVDLYGTQSIDDAQADYDVLIGNARYCRLLDFGMGGSTRPLVGEPSRLHLKG